MSTGFVACGISTLASQSPFNLILKVAALWIALLFLPFTERTLLKLETYYGLFIGLGLAFVIYGLTIHLIFAFLQHTEREPVYIWFAFLLWSFFICCILAVFAIEYDLLPHTSEPFLPKSRPLIDYLYYEVMTFTTVGYGDIVPLSAHGKLLAICTALLGFAHAVTFVALMLQALTQHPLPKVKNDRMVPVAPASNLPRNSKRHASKPYPMASQDAGTPHS